MLTSKSSSKHVVGAAIVFAGMLLLFLPHGSPYFVYGVFTATFCMVFVAIWLTKYRDLFKPKPWTIAVGIISAALLYGIFYEGNTLIADIKPLGIGQTSEGSIYGLISSHQIELQILILALDAIGFESYFRGTLQNRLALSMGNKAILSVFLSALVDASFHLISLNPLWVITTFIADSVWGLTYFYTKDLSSSMLSHFIWDLGIFVINPIK